MISKRLVQTLACAWLTTLVLTAHAAKVPASPDEFEGKFEECLKKDQDKRYECLALLLRKYGEADAEQIAHGTRLLKWVGNDSVYKFHRLDEKNYADIRLVRRYLIEDTRGNLMGIKFQYRRILGTLYIDDVFYTIGPQLWDMVEAGKL